MKTQKHLRNEKPKSSKCSMCNYEISSHWNLKLHILSQHSTIEERMTHKYYCKTCDFVFFYSTML